MKQAILKLANYIFIILIAIMADAIFFLKTENTQLKSANDELTEQNIRLADCNVSRELWNDFIVALAWEESRWNTNAVGDKDDVGLLQVTPILVKEVNRIIGYEGYTLEDRYDPHKNIEMFCIIQDYKNPKKDLHLAMKIWNPRADLSYHRRVIKNITKIQENRINQNALATISVKNIVSDTLNYTWKTI